MEITNSTYNIQEINDFLKVLPVNETHLISIISEGWTSLPCLKLALEIYGMRTKPPVAGKLDFSSKILLKMACVENASLVCEILRIVARFQTEERFYEALEFAKELNFESKDQLFVNLQLLSAFMGIRDSYRILNSSFVTSLHKIVLGHNLSKEKNYFITQVLKPFVADNPTEKNEVFNEIIIALDLYTISFFISEITPHLLNDSFWVYIQDVIVNKNNQWEYKLALNLLKTFIKTMTVENFNLSVSKLLKGHTMNLNDFQAEWDNFFVLIEVAEEKQLHLVLPSLVMLKKINKLNYLWIVCIHNKLLNHMQLSIVYITAMIILENESFYRDNYKECLQCLLMGINRNDASEHALTFFQKLSVFTNTIDVQHYDMLLKESASINWTPITAWLFYSHCISRLKYENLDSIKYEYIKEILNNLTKLPHKYIRDGCFNYFHTNLVLKHSDNQLKLSKLFNSYNTSSKKDPKPEIFDSDLIIKILLNPDDFNETEISRAYSSYNSDKSHSYSSNVFGFWTERILTKKVPSIICTEYINHLSSLADYCILERVIDRIFTTQPEDVSTLIYKSLKALLKPFPKQHLALENIMLNCYEHLKTFKQKDLQIECYNSYFTMFFLYCNNGINTDNPVWSSVLNEVIQDEIMASSWIHHLPEHLETQFLPYILPLIYFGNVYTKHKRFEDMICYQILKENPKLRGTPCLETNIRLRAMEICAKLRSHSSELWGTLFNIPTKRYFPDSSDHIRCLRSAQMILILMQDTQFQNRNVFDNILWHLCEENHQPSVRQLMQWILINLSLNNHEYHNVVMEKFISSTSLSALTSLILVLYHVSLRRNDDFLERVIDAMLQYTTGAIFKLRVYSQVAIYKLITKQGISSEKYTLITRLLKKTIDDNYDSVTKVLQTDWEFFETFDPKKNYHLKTILVDIPKLNNVTSSEWQYIEFNLEKCCYKDILPVDENVKPMNILIKEKIKGEGVENWESHTMNIQKKIIPSSTTDVDSQLKYCANLVVVASLITSSANLGGLARTCEIYGVEKLIVHDGKVTANKEFKSLSMSSECWLNIVQIKSESLIEYIVEEKCNGYTILGAEQTCESIKLNKYNFPEKCVLLLGNEKEGIPPQLLPYLDVCIEIPQFGVIRSLNVHVAGSTFIWEYVRQRRK